MRSPASVQFVKTWVTRRAFDLSAALQISASRFQDKEEEILTEDDIPTEETTGEVVFDDPVGSKIFGVTGVRSLVGSIGAMSFAMRVMR